MGEAAAADAESGQAGATWFGLAGGCQHAGFHQRVHVGGFDDAVAAEEGGEGIVRAGERAGMGGGGGGAAGGAAGAQCDHDQAGGMGGVHGMGEGGGVADLFQHQRDHAGAAGGGEIAEIVRHIGDHGVAGGDDGAEAEAAGIGERHRPGAGMGDDGDVAARQVGGEAGAEQRQIVAQIIEPEAVGAAQRHAGGACGGGHGALPGGAGGIGFGKAAAEHHGGLDAERGCFIDHPHRRGGGNGDHDDIGRGGEVRQLRHRRMAVDGCGAGVDGQQAAGEAAAEQVADDEAGWRVRPFGRADHGDAARLQQPAHGGHGQSRPAKGLSRKCRYSFSDMVARLRIQSRPPLVECRAAMASMLYWLEVSRPATIC